MGSETAVRVSPNRSSAGSDVPFVFAWRYLGEQMVDVGVLDVRFVREVLRDWVEPLLRFFIAAIMAGVGSRFPP